MSDWRDILDQAELAIAEGRFDDALDLCKEAEGRGQEAGYFAGLLRGDTLLQLGEPLGALAAYDAVVRPGPPDGEVQAARGQALFELGRLAEARTALEVAVDGFPADPPALAPLRAEALFSLGLIAELQGRADAHELLREARRLDPERFREPPSLSDEDFHALVEDVLAELPPEVRRAIDNIPVVVEDLPDPNSLAGPPPLSPLTLGMFVGVPPSQQSVLDPVDSRPPMILLFKKNIERAFPDPDLLREEIRVTLLHEIGHALGLNEDDLDERGLA